MAGVTYYSPLMSADEQTRSELREQAELEDRGLIADVRVPAVGHYLFFTADDQQLAYDMGYTSFDAVYRARDEGTLDPDDRPEILFFPNETFLDRNVDRTGETGYWRFLTADDAQIAAAQYGGMHGFGEQPTASQIIRLGKLYDDYGLRDSSHPLREIEIAFNPGYEDPLEEGDDPVLAPRDQGKRPSPIPHDPTNGDPGGEHDQTGDANSHVYDSANHNGRYVTVDRSPVRKGVKQPHKLWIYTRSGWIKYPHIEVMDWDDMESIKALNRWRNQGYRRSHIFAPVRAEAREVYSDEERRWLRKIVAEAKGEQQPNSVPDITRRFNERFEIFRSEAGITAILDRLRREYHQVREAGEDEVQGVGQLKEKKRRVEAEESLFVGSDESEIVDDEDAVEFE